MAISDNTKSVPDNILTHRKTDNTSQELTNNSNVQNSNECRTVSIFSFSSFIRLVTVPIQYFYKSVIDLFKFVWSLVGFNNNQNNDPIADISSFKKIFETQYGENHPVFFLGSYNQAVTQAKQDLKFLLVYLHNSLHEDTEKFCKLTLTHNEVVNYIKRNNLIFWACSIDLNEGYTVSRLMRESTYPFLALVVLKNNKMMIVKKFQGKLTVEKLLSQLQKAIDDNEASLVSTRLERQQRSMDQLIRKQQDQDYLDSLRADQEKDRKRKEERDKKEKEEQEKLKKEQEELNNLQKLIDLKETLKDKILIEPDASGLDVIKLLIKLPNGKKIERRFLKNVSIKYLFYFVFCHSESPLKFIIKTSFPAKELPCLSPTLSSKDVISSNNKEIPTFEQFGIKNSEVLYVHDLEA